MERLAVAQGASVDEAVKGERRRATIEEMLATGAAIAAMPFPYERSPEEIMVDLNAP